MAIATENKISPQTPTIAAGSLPLHGRVAIVTGGSRGIGRAITIHLASLGASVALAFASNSDLADLIVAEINSSSTRPRAVAVRADISDPDAIKNLFDRAESAFASPVHILVNNAGIIDSSYPTVAATATEEWDRIFSVNTRGTFLCSREAANRLIRGGGGRIVNVTSSLVGSLRPGYGAYTASKAAVEAMTMIMAKELKGTGITANCVAPGPIATEMFFTGKTEEQVMRAVEENPLGRIGEPADVATVVGFLVTGAGEWINGQVIRVNGGYV